MSYDQQWRAALTRLTRLAQRQPEAQAWIEEMLEWNMPHILGAAVTVAEETGAPMPEALVKVLEENADIVAHEAVARSVPMHATALQDLAITSIRLLLHRKDWPPGEHARTVLVRRNALRVALANRLSVTERLAEARPVAEQAVSEAEGVLHGDTSARARSVDAYDVIARCQRASGDAGGAVETARRALALRREINDPYRPRAEGDRNLGLALLSLGMADEACRALTSAVSQARDLNENHRDTLLELVDQAAQITRDGGRQRALQVAVKVGWNPNGFDEAILDPGFRIESLTWLLHICLDALVTVLETRDRLPADLLVPALRELAACRALMGHGSDPHLGLRILRLLIAQPEIAAKSLSTDDFDAMAGEARATGGLELAISVRQAEVEFLRRTDPADRRALVNALSLHSDLLARVRPDDAVAVAREAVEMVGDTDPLDLACQLHNLSMHLGASGQCEEGLEMSSRAVGLINDALLVGRDVPPLVMMSMFAALVMRNQECGTEIDFAPAVVDAAARMIRDSGRETGADLTRLVGLISHLFDSAIRQRDMKTAQRIADEVSHLAARRPDDERIQLACGVLASRLLWLAVESGELDHAQSLLSEIIRASRNAPQLAALTIEHAQSATGLIDAYGKAGNLGAAAQLARQSKEALLSPVYLAACQRNLRVDQAEFIQIIQELAQQADSTSAGPESH